MSTRQTEGLGSVQSGTTALSGSISQHRCVALPQPQEQVGASLLDTHGRIA